MTGFEKNPPYRILSLIDASLISSTLELTHLQVLD